MADTVTRFKPPGLVSGLSLGPPKTHLTAARQAAMRLSEKRRRNAHPPYAEPPEPMAFPWTLEWQNSTALTLSTTGFEFRALESPDAATVAVPVQEETWAPEETSTEVAFEEEEREPKHVAPEMQDLLMEEPRRVIPPLTRPAQLSEPMPASALRIQLPIMSALPLRPKIVLAPLPRTEPAPPAPEPPAPEVAPPAADKPNRTKGSRAKQEPAARPVAQSTESLEKLASAVTGPLVTETVEPMAEKTIEPVKTEPEPARAIEALRERLVAEAKAAPVEPPAPPTKEPELKKEAEPLVAAVAPVTKVAPAPVVTPEAPPEPVKPEPVKAEPVKVEPVEAKREKRGRARVVEPVVTPAPEALVPAPPVVDRVPTFGMPAPKAEEETPEVGPPELFNIEQAAAAGGLSMGVKIGVGAVLAVVIGGIGIWKIYSGSAAASSKPLTGTAINAVEVSGMVTGEGGWNTDWGLDARGIKKVRQFSFLRPSMQLTDYRIEFQGEIEYKAMGWVFRASDVKNYYSMKLQIVKPGASPVVHLVRYAVVNGQESDRADKPLTMRLALDTVYRVRLDVQGSKFTTYVQGQIIDEWSDSKISKGGFGISNETGERGQIRAVQMWHLRPRAGQ